MPVTSATAPTAAAASAAAPAATDIDSLALRVWRKLCREPSLMVTAAYISVAFLGVWANVWFYREFELPVLQYMQASDYLVAGLRDPMYAVLLGLMLALVLMLSWPDVWRRRHPERVEALRARRWWWRLVFSNWRWSRWEGVGLSPATGITCAAIWGALWTTSVYVQTRAELVRSGLRGPEVEVTLLGREAPQPATARLLGTSNAYVFLWWPGARRAEAVPVTSVATLAVAVAAPNVPAAAAATPPEAPARIISPATR